MGRAPKVKALTVRFSEDEARMLEEIGEREDLSAGAIVRKALREYAAKFTGKTPKNRR